MLGFDGKRKATGVEIRVDGVLQTTTDANGRYFLSLDLQQEGVSNSFTIEASKKEFFFEPLTVTINENTNELPTIMAVAAKICGQVKLFDVNDDSSLVLDRSQTRHVYIKQLPNPILEQSWETEGIEDLLIGERKVKLDSKGEYCFIANVGLWSVYPEVLPHEKSRALTFQVPEHRCYVTVEGMSAISFSEIILTVSGQVQCIQPDDCKDLTVEISELGMTESPEKVKARTTVDA